MAPRKKKVPDEVLDELVENALLKRATGYEDTSGKSVPPDVRAAMYWLENRRPDRWKRNRNAPDEAGEIEFSDAENAL
jgi:hypothetical protein